MDWILKGLRRLRELLKKLASKGSTIFLSSHILGEISKIANRIGIIHEGSLVKEVTTNELAGQLIKKIVVKTANNLKALHELMHAGYRVELTPNYEIEITNNEAIENPENIAKLLVEKEVPPTQLYLFNEDLEMYFLRTITNPVQ